MTTDPDLDSYSVILTEPTDDPARDRRDVEYPNSFQQQHQRQYNFAVPAIEHWPDLLSRGIKTSTRCLVWLFRQIKSAFQEVANDTSPSKRYRDIPMTSNGSSSASSSSYRRVGLEKRRHLRPKRSILCGRVLCLLCTSAVMAIVFLVPQLQPFRNRVVWIRYFNHEEAIKVNLPYGRNVHVQDVKKIAIKELDLGYSVKHALGNVRLLARYGPHGSLEGDEIWDNDMYWSSPRHPIIAVEPRYGKSPIGLACINSLLIHLLMTIIPFCPFRTLQVPQ